jgi:predicted RNA-binding protein with PUA-like domain
MALFRRSRLSVQPVTPAEYALILTMAGLDPGKM